MTDRNLDIYAERRIRRGKTAKDVRNGLQQRRAKNQAARDEWHRDGKKKADAFPPELLKGNGNGAARRPERRPGKKAR